MLKKLASVFSTSKKIEIIFLFVIVTVGSVLELMGVAIFTPYINLIMDTQAIQKAWYLKAIYEFFHFSDAKQFLLFLTVTIIAVYVLKNAYLIWEKNLYYKFSYTTQRELSTRLLRSYMEEPYTFHVNRNIADLQRSLQDDTGYFMQVIMYGFQLVAEILVCIMLGIYLFMVSHSITVVVLGLLVICVGFFTMIAKKNSQKLGKECQQYKAKIYQWQNQALGGIKEIKILERENYFSDEYGYYYKKYADDMTKIRLISVIPKHIVEAVSIGGLLVAIIIKMLWGQKDFQEFIPQLTVFAVAAFRLLPSVGRINEYVTNILYAIPSVDLIYKDLSDVGQIQQEKEIQEVSDWSFQHNICLKNIVYSYPDSEEKVLNEANCEIPKGAAVAFIGNSGAGKTTTVDIILGLLKPQYGKVMADDLDIIKHLGTWHREIGYIPQVIYLSDDTIRNNIAFGIDANAIDDMKVMNALKKAQLDEYVENLPDGLDTFVGDRGVRLSGGQRQRIGIARALYHDPAILILDEATSALDNETEAAVMESVDHLHGEKTLIIIAHRLSTIRNVDTIYEVRDGKIIEKSKEEVFAEQVSLTEDDPES